MNSLQKLINLAKNESGKFFILDDSGEPQLVVMSIAEYEAMKNESKIDALVSRMNDLSQQTDELNRHINDAQLEEFMDEDEEEETSAEEKVNDTFYIEPITEEGIKDF